MRTLVIVYQAGIANVFEEWHYNDFDNAPFNESFGICYPMEGVKA